MRFVQYMVDSTPHSGTIERETIREIIGDIFTSWTYTGKVFSVEEVKLLAPLQPNQIIGIGANYVAKEEELSKALPDIPVIFFKPLSSVIGPKEQIVIPETIDEVIFESELAVVIGKEAKNVPEDDVFEYVFGYTVANDVSAPQFFTSEGQWTIGKAFDTFTPLGPVIETELNPFAVQIEARLNGEVKQNSSTGLMITPICKLISFLTSIMTLNPGDVILTGSPVGAEMVKAGDVIECSIKEIGTLRNSFVLASD